MDWIEPSGDSETTVQTKPFVIQTKSKLQQSALMLAVAVVYFAAAKLGLSFAFIHTNVSPVWPPTGIAIAALLLYGVRVWPAVLIGAFAANFLTPVSIGADITIAAGNTLEAVAAVTLLRTIKFENSFKEAKDVLKFLVAAVICTAISATIGNLALALTGGAAWSDFLQLWRTWWLGDLTGALIVAPLVLAWLARPKSWLPRERFFEALLLLGLLSLAANVTWRESAGTPFQFFPPSLLIVPFLLWAAFRLGHRGVTLAIISVSAFAIWGTAKGSGPFSTNSPNNSLLMLQLFLAANAVTYLFLVAVVQARRHAEEAVRMKEGELQQITHTTPLMLTRCTRDLRYAFVNHSYAAMVGRTPEQVIGRPIIEIMGKEGFKTIRPHLERVLNGERVEFEDEVHIEGVGGRWLRVAYHPDRNDQGKIVGWLASISDVTDRKLAEDALRQSERELAEFFENASEPIHWVGPDGTILRANQAELRMLGYPAEDYIGRNILEFHVDQSKILDILNRLDHGETIVNYAAQMIHKDGSIRDVLINSSAYFQNNKFIHTRCFTRDITEQLLAEKDLRQFAAIVESTDDVIIAKDLNGTITNWNAAAERLYGYKAEEMIGKSVSILIPADRPDEGPNILAKLRAGERIDHYESVRVAKDGRRLDVSLTVSPIRDANGIVVGASKIARDITDKKRAQLERERLLEREEKARAAAEAANKVKDEFLATLSHELRTPLNAILGWASMLRSNKLNPEESAHAIEIIDRNAKVQSRLIEGVLDVSRIVSGKFHIECHPVQLREAVTAAVDSIHPSANARNIQLELEMDSNVALVAGDLSRLQQIIWNLLSNAVKFTEPGGEIKVELAMSGPDVEIIVRDTGQGISGEFLPHVFDRFRQADSSTTRKHGGLGLGLAIVRHLVELHGGTVTAESEGEGKGTTFRVRLPLIAADVASSYEPPKQLQPGGPNPAAMLRGLKVLVVEDEIDARELLAEMLSRCEAEVRAAGSAQEALELVNEWGPEVLVSDISMPEVDGYALIQRVRDMASNGSIPAIAVTAHARNEDQQRALDAGFHAFLAKPIELPELATCIAIVTGKLRCGENGDGGTERCDGETRAPGDWEKA